MTDIIGRELNYSERKNKVSHGNIKYTRVIPLSGSTSTTITTADVEVLFELPPSVFNLSKSYLNFDISFVAAGTGNSVNHYLTGCSPISRLVLQTRSGQFLCDIPNFAQYAYATALPTKIMSELSSCDLCLGTRTTIGAIAETTAGIQLTAGTADLKAVTTVVATNANAILAVRYNIPLKFFAGTIFAINKLLYFGEPIQCRVVFNAYTRLGHVTGTAGPIANAPTASSLAIQLATERDQNTAKQIMDLYETSGINILVPYVYGTKYVNNATSGNYSVNLRYSKAFGRSLLRAFTINMNAAEATTTLFTPEVPTDIRTAINNVFQQDSALVFANQEPMLFMKDNLNKTPLINSAQFALYQTFFEDWCKHYQYERELDETPDGLPLDDELTYSVYISPAAASNTYIFVVVQRSLMISKKAGTMIN